MTSTPVDHRSKQHIIQDIEALTRQPGFLYTLMFLCYRDLTVDLEEAASRNWRESLSYQELGLLGGLLVKHPVRTAHASADVVELQVSKVDALFKELHDAYTARMIYSFKSPTTTATPSSQTPQTSGPYGMGNFFAEAIFYAGSGAYDFQYLNLAEKRYEADKQWIVQHRGFSIETACMIASQLKSRVEARLQELTPQESLPDFCDQLLHVFSFEPREIMGITPVWSMRFSIRSRLNPARKTKTSTSMATTTPTKRARLFACRIGATFFSSTFCSPSPSTRVRSTG